MVPVSFFFPPLLVGKGKKFRRSFTSPLSLSGSPRELPPLGDNITTPSSLYQVLGVGIDVFPPPLPLLFLFLARVESIAERPSPFPWIEERFGLATPFSLLFSLPQTKMHLRSFFRR